MKLRELRERANLTRHELAYQASISSTSIQNIEAGAGCKGETLKKLADALAIAFTLQGKPTSPADVLTELTGISTEIPVLQEAA